MALYREDGTQILDRAAFDALTEPVTQDPPVRLTQAVYQDVTYPGSDSTSFGTDTTNVPARSVGRRLLYPAGHELPTSEVDALFA